MHQESSISCKVISFPSNQFKQQVRTDADIANTVCDKSDLPVGVIVAKSGGASGKNTFMLVIDCDNTVLVALLVNKLVNRNLLTFSHRVTLFSRGRFKC